MSAAEQLVGEARARRERRMATRERMVLGVSASAFLLAAFAIASFVPVHRPADWPLMAALVIGYAIVSRVRFEFGNYYVAPEQLLIVPMLLLAPLPYVPLLVVSAVILSTLPDTVGGNWARDRWLGCISDSWFIIAPTLVLAALAPGGPDLRHVEVYALAFAAQASTDLSWTWLRNWLLDAVPSREVLRGWAGTARVDAILTPIALLITLPALEEPLVLAAIAPLVWLLETFSRDRHERYAATLELSRAYRGTVMLLSDVVEFDDSYTADHSRSVVDLVQSVADEMRIDPNDRQELEFAALLHDVGKIAIPKQILNKPARLSAEEFAVMRTHTIEGQFMLDRVGGLLGRVGEIVRCCHERWDGAGYPDGISGDEIPLAARIVFSCDAYNAMTTDRPYRDAMSREDAVRELAENAGTQFDPRVVISLIKVVEQGEPAPATSEGVRAVLASAPRASRVGVPT
jgi:HD-GYP domain-containing protein (c-di-GMP phosphodiesterase class II)